MRILSVRGALPDHRYEQAQITSAFTESMLQGEVDRTVVERLHRNAGVETRHLALPLELRVGLERFLERRRDGVPVRLVQVDGVHLQAA